MQRLLRKRRLSYYQRLIITIFFCTCVIGLLLTLGLYSLFSSTMQSEILRVNQAMLTQTKNQADLVYEQVTALGLDLLADSDMLQFMLSAEHDPILEAALMRKLTTASISSANVDSIIVYNGNRSRYLNSRGIQYPPEQDIVDMINGYENDTVYPRFTKIIPRVYTAKNMYGESTNQDERSVLTYLVYPSLKQLMPGRYAIAINVRADFFMESIMDSLQMLNGSATILNGSGQALVSSALGAFGEDLSRLGYVQSILQQDASSGHFFDAVNSARSLVSFLRSDNREGWYFLQVVPVRLLYPGLTGLRNSMVIVFLALLALAALTSFLLTKRLYRPVAKLLQNVAPLNAAEHAGDEFMRIESSYADAQHQMRRMGISLERSSMRVCLHALFIGADLNQPIYQRALDTLSKGGQHFTVVIARIIPDGADDTPAPDVALDAVEAFTLERLRGQGAVYAQRMDARQSALLLCFNAPAEPAVITACLQEVQRQLRESYPAGCLFGVGDSVAMLEEIHESYLHAQSAAQYGYHLLEQSIFWHEALQPLEQAAYSYPVQTEKRLMEAMHLGDVDAIHALLQSLAVSLRDTSYQTARLTVSQIMLALLREYATIEEVFALQNAAVEINRADTLDMAIRMLTQTCERIIRMLLMRRSSRKLDLVDKVRAHMEEHLSHSDYDVSHTAAALSMSAAYLGRRFKAESGASFRAYLLDLRMQRAESLLRETKLPIVDVSAAVGIPNTNYFFLLFKKKYGMTPSDFRRAEG